MRAVVVRRGGAWMDGRYVPSLLAAIGDVIERHMIAIGFLPPKGSARDRAIEAQIVNLGPGLDSNSLPRMAVGVTVGTALPLSGSRLRQCPKCGEAALIRLEGCDQCT